MRLTVIERGGEERPRRVSHGPDLVFGQVRDILRTGLVLHFRLAKKSLDEFGEYPRHAWYWRWQEIDRLALHLVASAGLGSAPGAPCLGGRVWVCMFLVA